MKLSLGFSPCPNDTFIFDALVHQRIDTEGLEFQLIMADVEELNRKAFARELDITKVSYHAYLHLIHNYILLDSGSALGFGTGPLLIAREMMNPSQLVNAKVAIPGKYTTASLLFSLAYPQCRNITEFVFSEIEQAILDRRVDAGIIIHENRFTYQEKGLKKITDLGDYWEDLTLSPIPLGGIVANRKLPQETVNRFSRVLRRSVVFAIKNQIISDFVRTNAQEMSDVVMQKHIDLYVNEFTISLGDVGRKAIHKMFEIAVQKNLIDAVQNEIFFDS